MQITLVIPGLIERLAEWQMSYTEIAIPGELEKTLSRASRLDTLARGLEATLWSLLDPSCCTQETEIPYSGPRPENPVAKQCWHADPVHLRADVSDLVLVDAQHLNIQTSERDALKALINTHLAPINGQFWLNELNQGALALDTEYHCSTTPLSIASGKGIASLLPTGPDRLPMHRLINELQMLLYNAPFNQLREQRGLPTLNGLWLWGGATPVSPPPARFDLIFSNHPYVESLARYAKIPWRPLPERAAQLASVTQGDCLLICLDQLQSSAQYDDMLAWEQQLIHITQTWITPLNEMLNAKKIKNINLYTCQGSRFELSKERFWHHWRPTKPLTELQ